jgi:hypothetical protein
VDDPPFHSESFRTPVHTYGIFNLSSVPVCSFWRTPSRHDIFDRLGMSPNQPTSSYVPITSTAYTVPLNHFNGTTSNFVTASELLLVGTHTILPLQFTSSTTVPQVAHFSTGSSGTIQALIGTPLPLRSNPSLPPRYNALSSSIPNPTQGPSGGPSLFIPPGYKYASSFVPTSSQVLPGGASLPPTLGGSNRPSPSSSNLLGGTSHFVTYGYQLPVGGQPQVGGKPQFGGHNPFYGKYTPGLQTQPWNFPFQGNQQLPGGKILNQIILYPLISDILIQALLILPGVKFPNIMLISKVACYWPSTKFEETLVVFDHFGNSTGWSKRECLGEA